MDRPVIRRAYYTYDAQDLGQEEVGMAALALPPVRPTTSLTENAFERKWEQPAASAAAFWQQSEKVFVFPTREAAYRFVVRTNSLPSWVEPTISAYSGIQSLNDNWDSYGGKKISHDIIRLSLSILAQIMESASPAPSVVPLADGGLQLEWHRKQQDLEIVFPVDESAKFYYTNKARRSEDEGSIDEIVRLAQLVKEIA